jgi:hypothetical protein
MAKDNEGDRKPASYGWRKVEAHKLGFVKSISGYDRELRAGGARTRAASKVRDPKLTTLCKLDYLYRGVIRVFKEAADTLNYVTNHLFRHFWIDRQR